MYFRHVDICWIAYLTENDEDKRIVYKSEKMDNFEYETCQTDFKKTLVMYNGKENNIFSAFIKVFIQTNAQIYHTTFLIPGRQLYF